MWFDKTRMVEYCVLMKHSMWPPQLLRKPRIQKPHSLDKTVIFHSYICYNLQWIIKIWLIECQLSYEVWLFSKKDAKKNGAGMKFLGVCCAIYKTMHDKECTNKGQNKWKKSLHEKNTINFYGKSMSVIWKSADYQDQRSSAIRGG